MSRDSFRRTFLRGVGATAAATLGLTGAGTAAAAPTDGVDRAAYPDADWLRSHNADLVEFGPRPPASPAHQAFVDYVVDRLDAIPGVDVSTRTFTIDRWLAEDASLHVQGVGEVPVAADVPYTEATGPEGVTADLTFVPEGQSLADADIEGDVVLREFTPESVPYAELLANAYTLYDPDVTLLPHEEYQRDWLSNGEMVRELLTAGDRGAAGILFVLGFPREQVEGHYQPYRGIQFDLPGLFLGADEGARLRRAAEEGSPRATLHLESTVEETATRSVFGRLPGVDDERVVLQTHTDGPNVIEENGVPGILSLAEYFAGMTQEQRPRDLEFAFTSGHFYGGSANSIGATRYARRLDEAYEAGTVALVLSLEHFGVEEYVARDRDGPGRRLEKSGLAEPAGIFCTESPALVEGLSQRTVEFDLRRSVVMRGARQPEATVPPFQRYGGEGTFFHERAIPTVQHITGPWNLFNHGVTLEDLDFDRFRSQTLAFADFVHDVSDLPRAVIAGADTAYRATEDHV